MRRPFALAALAALLVPTAHAQFGAGGNTSGGPLRPEQATFDVTYYALDLSIRPDTKTIGGTLLMEAVVVHPTDAVLLDLDDALTVERVDEVGYVRSLGSESEREVAVTRPFERGPGTIRVALGRTAQPREGLRLRVTYGGAPHVAARPPWDGGFSWETAPSGEPWVAVSCQGEGADLWWPVKDHPSDEPDSMRIALTVPAGLRAIANGRWEGRTGNADGTATERWFVSTPINPYGVSFGIGPYEVVEMTYESPLDGALAYTMPAQAWVLPERLDDARRQLPGWLDGLAFNERTFGPYGWRADGYKVLHTPYLGMEHQSLIAYGSTFEDNAAGFDWLHYHEMAHEWWANLGTAADWRDFWIHESFANYAEALYAEDLARRRGEDPDAAYRAYLAGVRGRIVNAIPVAPRESRTTKQMYTLPDGRFNGDIYFKGSWFLHTLRWLVDDDPAFLDAFRSILYPDPSLERETGGRQARFLSLVDVQRAFERASGRDLDAYFEAYLRHAALPALETTTEGSELVYRWRLPDGQDATAFELPIEVSWGGVTRRVEMPGGVGRLTMPRVRVDVDPNGRLLFTAADGRRPR